MCLYLPQTRLIESGDTWLGICAVMTTDIEVLFCFQLKLNYSQGKAIERRIF
jgi:hypothetical protein